MAEPLTGFGERIAKRARLPVAVLLALPFLLFAVEYFFFLLENGLGAAGAIEKVKKDAALFVWLAACRQ